ncbi:MAG: DUF1326 domain-containing protein [Rhodospirillaceae bacterium]|jgi:hypothetical protein|nr:DUF1326 domain-containing protein [Rhodospirillaceae bacterium]MBT5676397.1 DUF1326 domain-containing protein [Rhodospirillaceae bacterium]MBT5779802.1 DUF1326 domain-containing protein [Rhodospirillaceae bacterium]
MIDWRIKAREFANCNCDYGCPCQFNALPTHGTCEAAVGYQIDEGHFGDVKLDGVRAAAVYKWPGPVHGGDGEMQVIIDESASDAQRDAVFRILKGEETEPMTTVWSVYTTMSSKIHDPLFLPIDFEVDVENRTARLVVPGVIDGIGEPIRNPATGNIHRARIDLPHGFEFELAEMGSGTTTTSGAIELSFEKSYGQFAEIHLGNKGVIRSAA